MLTGRNTIDNPIAINPSIALAMQPTIRSPTWTQLAAASDGAAIKAISVPRSGRKRDHGFRSLLPIPAWLAAALMAANTEDAASLCITAIQAIRDFDTRAASESFIDARETENESRSDDDDDDDDNDKDENTAPPGSARAILEWIPMFLWAVATKAATGCPYALVDTAPMERWCASVRAKCFGPLLHVDPGSNGNSPPTTVPSNQLDIRLGALTSTLERMAQMQDERTKAEKDEKEIKAFRKLEPFTQEMILFASEPAETDADTDIFTIAPRLQPVSSYAKLLALGNVAQAKLHLDLAIQTRHKCPISLPLATVNAILNGRLTWSDHTNPEAFSIFACFKPGALAINTTSDEFLALQLKSSEGKGLSDADVARSTRVEHRAPRDVHELGEFIGAFALILAFIFGSSSTVHKAINGWVTHIRDNELLYTQQIQADRAFGCKVLALIDRAVQLYFRECMVRDRQLGAARMLTFDRYQNEIMMNTFTYTALPASIARLVSTSVTPTSTPNPTPSSSSHSTSGGHTPVFNFEQIPTFQATPDRIARMLNTLSTAPNWTGPSHGPCKPCPKYHSGGACIAECPRADTHRCPRHDEIGPYIKWLRDTGNANTSPHNPNNRSNKFNNDSGTSNNTNKRRGAPSPSPERSTKTVKFAARTKTDSRTDF